VPESVADLGEFGLIARLNELLRREGAQPSGLSVGIGDDTAAFRPREGWELLVTCDAMVEGRHYLPERTTYRSLGRRAMAMNVSDVGAMGGRPLYALVSLGLRASTGVSDVEELYRGFLAELNPFGAAVIGGNLTKTDHAQFIDVTLVGEVEAGRALRRSSARPGDAILVTGCPGQAAAGLAVLLGPAGSDPLERVLLDAYREPRHRAREGRAVLQANCARGMIDVSDGFLGDLGHICDESGVGAEVVQADLPVSEPLRRAAGRLGRDPYDWILGDSDDYELIITCPAECVPAVRAAIATVGDVSVTLVGRITERSGKIELVVGGERRVRARSGWDHFAEKGT
jgi:thiamine-monophosphate kinase